MGWEPLPLILEEDGEIRASPFDIKKKSAHTRAKKVYILLSPGPGG